MVTKFNVPAVFALTLLLALGLNLTVLGGSSPAQQHPSTASDAKEGSDSAIPNPEARPESPDALYYDFSDVLIPKQLKLKKDESFVYDTSSFTAGFLTFEGRVEMRSLTRFFVDAMSQDNWLLGAKFTHKEVVLLFEKPNKRSIMYITESRFSTKVRIWVAPFLGAK